ncbi:MAG: hypothetical protein ACOYOQ_00080 [Microthrixaceae bacterium]
MADAPIAPAPPILPTPTDVTFLTSADPLPPAVAGFDRWRTGLDQREAFPGLTGANGARTGYRRMGCTVDEVTDDIQTSDTTEFRPYAVYVQHGCDGRVDEAVYRAEAEALLKQRLPTLMAKETVTGAVEPENPSLSAVAEDLSYLPSLSGSSDMERAEFTALSILAAYEANTLGARGVLWIPTATLSPFMASQFVTRQGNRFVTATGHTVMAVPGVDGSTPPTGGSWELGEAWFYVSGPVQAALGEVVVHLPNTGLTERRNRVEVWAEIPVFVRFPTQNVYASKYAYSAGS